MVETEWPELAGKSIRYAGNDWELTGTVDVRKSGEFLGVNVHGSDVRRRRATLQFASATASPSLNPGNLGEHFDSIERDQDTHYLVVKNDSRTYRYELLGIEQ